MRTNGQKRHMPWLKSYGRKELKIMTLASNLSINFREIQSLKKFPMAYYDNIKCLIYGYHCKIRYLYLDILL